MEQGCRQRAFGSRGLTILEVVIVLSVVAVTVSLAGVAFRAPAAAVYATNVQSLILQSRFESIRRGVPIVVGWSDTRRRFEARLANVDNWCDLPDTAEFVILQSDPANLARLDIDSPIADESSLVWIPSGQARTCGGQVFSPLIARISDARVTRNVSVSFGGRVVVE